LGKAIGIDLGTTNSVVAVIEGGEPVIITNAEGAHSTPSVVHIDRFGRCIVGEKALKLAIIDPANTTFAVKRQAGQRITYSLRGKDYSPEEITARLLQKLKTDAEVYLGHPVTEAVITVPAAFNLAQRTATKNAGEIAGLKVLRIINESTAAAVAYGLDRNKEEKVLVFDLGGGAFDVTLLDIIKTEDGGSVLEVLATNGDTHLGGDDWDQRIVDYVADEFRKESGIDIKKDRQALQRVREAAEKAKIELSNVTQTNINLPFISSTPEGQVHVQVNLSRARFEALTRDLVERCFMLLDRAIKDALLTLGEIDEIVLVGGATRMPMIQERVRQITGKEPNRSLNPDEAVAIGAAVQAGVLSGDAGSARTNILLLDATPLSLGIETLGGVMTRLIERNTSIPTRKSETFTTAGGESLRSFTPEEMRNTEEEEKPDRKPDPGDGQTSARVRAYQGEEEMVADNEMLGELLLSGIPLAPGGIPQIEVTFDIDANGIVSVSARDIATGREQKITITGTGNLNKDEIDRMVREAAAHAEEDKAQRERAETRNKAESMIYQTEKQLKDLGDKALADLKTTVENAIANLRTALNSNDTNTDELKSLILELEATTYKLSEILYQQAIDSSAQNNYYEPDDSVHSEAAASHPVDETMDFVQAQLASLLVRYGPEMAEDTTRLRALLRDLCPHHRRECNLLLMAQQEQVPAELRTSTAPHQLLIPRLVQRLRDHHAVEESAAGWAVESWRLALAKVAAIKAS
jgi:molecular chaperone DnaK